MPNIEFLFSDFQLAFPNQQNEDELKRHSYPHWLAFSVPLSGTGYERCPRLRPIPIPHC